MSCEKDLELARNEKAEALRELNQYVDQFRKQQNELTRLAGVIETQKRDLATLKSQFESARSENQELRRESQMLRNQMQNPKS